MKRKLSILCLVLAIAVGAFALGYLSARRHASQTGSTDRRKVLYYVDPMNPAHTSDKPGLAPCGMKMEPVYADLAGVPAVTLGPAVAPGTVALSLQKQQLIGVRTETVEKKPLQRTLRLLGRVAIDETRLYRVNATVDGWITKIEPYASGRLVKKNETLATFYSSEFLAAGQALLFALNAVDRVTTPTNANPAQLAQINQFAINLRQYKDSLRNLGMGELQIDEMIRTRQYMENINITAPADGFIMRRNVSAGQRFDKGAELFQIADLSKVWIVADVFENEDRFVKPGTTVGFTVPGRMDRYTATLTADLPQFDSGSRTLKLRFEADNPDYVLKADMFVDVEIPVTLPESVVIPAEAVLDTGTRKIVFVEKSSGVFEPRAVRTGERMGGLVRIAGGLMAGERVVVSGNFLLDSESRMKLAAAGVAGTPVQDPVCGMAVDEQKAKAAGRVSEQAGQAYYFCNEDCKRQFDAAPSKYVKAAPAASGMTGVGTGADTGEGQDPVCNMKVDVAAAKEAKLVSEHGGKTYYFCGDNCKRKFDADPGKFLKEPPAGGDMAMPMPGASDPAQPKP